MKLFKITTIIILTIVLTLSLIATVIAAPNDDVIQALKDAGVPETYIIQAENYFKTTELTQAEADAAIVQINIVNDILEDAKVEDLTELSDAEKQQVLAAVMDAGEAINLEVQVKKNSDGTYTISAVDESGDEVAVFTSDEVKRTGGDYTLLFMGAGLLLLAIGSTFVIKKKAFN